MAYSFLIYTCILFTPSSSLYFLPYCLRSKYPRKKEVYGGCLLFLGGDEQLS